MEKGKSQLGEPTVTQVISGGRRKLHYLYPDQTELVEELDVNSNEVLLRKWKRPSEFGEGQWEFEIGEPQKQFNPESDLLAPSGENPIFLRKDTEERFEWRVRNLKYPKETYQITVDHNTQEIVIRTTNKKYFKRFDIPDMKRNGIKLEESSIAWKYQNNTLIVGYDKPDKILELELKKRQEIQKLGKSQTGPSGLAVQGSTAAQSLDEGNVQCKQQ
eukprot:403375340